MRFGKGTPKRKVNGSWRIEGPIYWQSAAGLTARRP